jgi:hypothetical protein
MIKEFVPFELALKLKQLGFDEPCLSIWKNDKLISVGGHWGMNITHSMFGFDGDMFALDECRAPTFSQAFRWFREKFDMVGEINSYYSDKKWSFNYDIVTIFKEKGSDRFNTFEEAELACLDKLIEIVESKQ